MLKNIRIVSSAVAVVAVFILIFLLVRAPDTRNLGGLASEAKIGSRFSLNSARGGRVDSDSLAGKPYGVFFGYTNCPEVCPTTLLEMSQTLEAMGDRAKDFRLFFISVDPERDTALKLKDYMTNFHPQIEALVANPDELAKVARGFHAFYEKKSTSDGSYVMDHTATLYLMDRKGKFISTISWGEEEVQKQAKLQKILKP